MSDARGEQRSEPEEHEARVGDRNVFETSSRFDREGRSKMTLGEVQEALKDPQHPRYAEAKDLEQELAESMHKLMPKIDMSAHIKSITDNIRPLSGLKVPGTGIQSTLLAGLIPKIDMSSHLKSITDSIKPLNIDIESLAAARSASKLAATMFPMDKLPPISSPPHPSFDRSWMDDAMDSIAEARAEEVQRDIATLEFMRRVAEGIEAQNDRLDAAAQASKNAEIASAKRDRRNAWISGLTLFATVAGIGVAIVIATTG